MKIKTLLFLASALISPAVFAQGTFQNLDFEMASIVPAGGGNPSFIVTASDALPGWIAYISTSPTSAIAYDTISIGSPMVSIHDSLSPVLQPLQGDYSVGIQHSTGGNPMVAAVGQIGQLPMDAISLVFSAANFQNLQVTFAGNVLALVVIGSGPGHSTLGADISDYTGQTGELRFTHLGTSFLEVVNLDNIQFSDQPVPEPSALGLLAIGGVIFGWKLRRK